MDCTQFAHGKRVALAALVASITCWAAAVKPVFAESDAGGPPVDVVTEITADGARIVRGVTLDADHDLINHGQWTMWDRDGRLLAEGQYEFGVRTGIWMRVHHRDAERTFFEDTFKDFTGPFVSRANFRDGVLDGTWTIDDYQGRRIAQWSFKNGARHGVWTDFHPNGQRRREVNFDRGKLHGKLRVWSADGTSEPDIVFDQGRRVDWELASHADGSRKLEAMLVKETYELEGQDDWWNLQLAHLSKSDRPTERHGVFRVWHGNGQLAIEGRYENGVTVGQWDWWRADGTRYAWGRYVTGAPQGVWLWWNGGEEIIQTHDFSEDEQKVGLQPTATPAIR